jgi:hypothetical protein
VFVTTRCSWWMGSPGLGYFRGNDRGKERFGNRCQSRVGGERGVCSAHPSIRLCAISTLKFGLGWENPKDESYAAKKAAGPSTPTTACAILCWTDHSGALLRCRTYTTFRLCRESPRSMPYSVEEDAPPVLTLHNVSTYLGKSWHRLPRKGVVAER